MRPSADEVRELLEGLAAVPDDPEAPLGLDSFAMLALTEAIERRYGVRVRAADLGAERFGSLARIAAFLATRLERG